MAKKNNNMLGSWAFLIGVILALALGIIADRISAVNQTYMIWALVVIGLIVGFLNVTSRESNAFLMSGVSLIIASAFGSSVLAQIQVLGSIMSSFLMIFIPATIVVAIKNVFILAEN